MGTGGCGLMYEGGLFKMNKSFILQFVCVF